MGLWSIFSAAIVIDSTNNKILLDEGGVTALATIASGTYHMLLSEGDWIGTAVENALSNTFAGGNVYVVDYSSNPTFVAGQNTAQLRVRRSAGVADFRVRWLHASTTFDGSLLGFVAEKAAASAAEENSTSSPIPLYVPTTPYVIAQRSFDWVGVSRERFASGKSQISRSGSKGQSVEVVLEKVDGRRVFDAEAGGSTLEPATLESWLDYALDGREVVVASGDEDGSSGRIDEGLAEVIFRGVLTEENASMRPAPARMGLSLWDFSLHLAERDT